MTDIEDVWADDKLDRRVEAKLLEDVLVMEVEELQRLGRGQAYVLAIDAAYGEGKSFFLSRFCKQLALKHPVAFIDAWVDDANNEPLLAIMAAINDALSPFLKQGAKAKERLKGAMTAALPIFGKVLLAATNTATKKYLGDAIPDEIVGMVDGRSRPSVEEQAVGEGISEATANISRLADKVGADMLAAFKARQTSKATFKSNMTALVAGLRNDTKNLGPPLFVVIDELDRCRPDYAIKVLEEVKHLFDIPGVVFVMAMHGDQLENSIAAVYGERFDSKAYLNRFFNRRYTLRRLTLRELVASRIAADDLADKRWNYPALMDPSGHSRVHDLAALIDAFCRDFGVSPREFSSIADGLRMFGKMWDEEVQIELVFLLGLLLRVVRATPGSKPLDFAPGVVPTAIHAGWDEGRPQTSDFKKIWKTYDELKSVGLFDLNNSNHRIMNAPICVDAMEQERDKRFGGRVSPSAKSLLDSYPDRVSRFGRLLDQQA